MKYQWQNLGCTVQELLHETLNERLELNEQGHHFICCDEGRKMLRFPLLCFRSLFDKEPKVNGSEKSHKLNSCVTDIGIV